METLQLFDEGPSSMITSTEEEQHELEPVIERYKGVVLQQNGNWGAQIYVNQSRIWLGTFKSEIAAACAYDSAAIKLNHGDSHRNFPWNEVTINEPGYQEHFTNAAILEMIRDGSYETKFIDFVRAIQSSNTGGGGGAGASALEAAPVVLMEGITCTQMFQKELTPSDVGKLNRLVIPKKHATRYLPAVTADTVEEVLLNFHDRMNRIWVFRYCYWRSSQSYVFTKGWNKFVKEIDLKARDTIVFYRCQEKVGLSLIRTFCMIDIIRSVGIISGAAADNPVEDVEVAENPTGSDEEDGKSKHLMEEDDSREVKKETKLFGVWIR